MKERGGKRGCCQDNAKCLNLALTVGAALMIVEIVIVILTLGVPESVGLSETNALTPGQRGTLAATTLLILAEGIIIALFDLCKWLIKKICAYHIKW